MANFSRVYKNLESSKTWKVGDKIMHNKTAGSSTDLNHIRHKQTQSAREAAQPVVLKRNKANEPIQFQDKSGTVWDKRTDGKWYNDGPGHINPKPFD